MKAILFAVFASLALSATANATIPGTCAMKFEVKIVDRFLSLKYTGTGQPRDAATTVS